MWVYYYKLSGRLGTLGLILRRPDGSCHSFMLPSDIPSEVFGGGTTFHFLLPAKLLFGLSLNGLVSERDSLRPLGQKLMSSTAEVC